MSLIKLTNISLCYGKKEIFQNFSLSIDQGEKVLIAGKSGNGKSTLLRVLLGFASVDDGDIYVNNQLVKPTDFSNVRKYFAYVNQDVTLRPGKVCEVLKEISKFSDNNYDGEFDQKLADLFEFDLNLLKKNTEELSGGERQRLGIILAIMLNRPVFLLDEVTSALDKDLKRKVADYFAQCKKTVVVISHDSEWLKSNKFRKVELT